MRLHLKIIILLLFISSLYANNSYENGKKLYLEKGCFACHGNKAEGMHNYPRLANRAKGFLSYKLKNFRNKVSNTQQQEMMVGYALDLSDTDIDDLSLFLYEYIDDDSGESYDYSFETQGDGGS